MNNIQQIIRILGPAVKGLPVILGIMVLMIFIASRIVHYSTPMYECTGKIKLEDANTDISNTNLFKTFDVFTQPGKIMAEVEVIKSPELLKSTLNNLPFDVSYFREGKIRTSEIFYDSPFNITYKAENANGFDIPLYISFLDTTHYIIQLNKENKSREFKGTLGTPLALEGLNILVTLNKEVLKNKPGISLQDKYYFVINSREKQIAFLQKYIDVKELDKEIPVVRIICKHPVPEKAMLLTNGLMETYINDGIHIKSGAAKKTVDFIDEQLEDISSELARSEAEMESYRMRNHITNTKLEVETDLKKVAQLKVQLTNVEMNLAILDTLDQYVNSDPKDFLYKAANYEGYGGLLYTEMMKRIKNLQAEKEELLLKYTPENEKVRVMDSKIADVVSYIKENIHNAKKAMRIQRDKIAEDIALAEIPFKTVPTKEKNLVILEREFKLNQEIYNFLNEKRTEASIVESATFSFHRIIQKASLPQDPVSPKKTFTLLVFGFLGLLLSLILIYGYEAISSRIKYKDQLEKTSTCPVITDIRHEKFPSQASQDLLGLASKMMMGIQDPLIITITSSIDHEGKTFVAKGLAEAFAAMEIKTLLIAANLRDHELGKTFHLQNQKGLSNFIIQKKSIEEIYHSTSSKGLYVMPEGTSDTIPEALFTNQEFHQRIQSLKNNFQVIIIDTPSMDTALDAIACMRLSDINLYVFRANYSKTKLMIEPDLLKEEYQLNNIKLILNDVAAFSKMKKDRGIRNTLKLLSQRIIDRLKNTLTKRYA